MQKATLEEVMEYMEKAPGLMEALVSKPDIDSVAVLLPGREPAVVRKEVGKGAVCLSCENVRRV